MISKDYLKFHARERLKGLFDDYMHLLGRRVLGTDEMLARFAASCEPCHEAIRTEVPEAVALDGRPAPELRGEVCCYEAAWLYRLRRESFQQLEILANGGLLLDRELIPQTGLGRQRASVLASILSRPRKSRRESCIVAPWPHYMEMTYGDFLLRVLPRISRIFRRLDASEKKSAVIAYPSPNTKWERAYLSRLGLGPERVIDTRAWKVECAPGGVVFAPSGEDTAWNQRSAHPGDYADARALFLVGDRTGPVPTRRIYLQRRGSGRGIVNEGDLLALLKSHDFEVVDPGAHPVEEQMAFCAGASVVLGVHGANLANMLWCPPGATIIELFNRGFRPSFYRKMAFSLNFDYRYQAESPMEPNDFSKLDWDLRVELGALDKFLSELAARPIAQK